MKATPPTTPPAMAPTFGPCEGSEGLGSFMHVMRGHALHVLGMSEQILPSVHFGHEGASGGHWTQRLKMVRKVRSTSNAGLVAFIDWYILPIVILDDMPLRAVVAMAADCARRAGSCTNYSSLCSRRSRSES